MADALTDDHGLNERHARRTAGLSRSAGPYQPVPNKDEPLIAMMADLAEKYMERGSGTLFD